MFLHSTYSLSFSAISRSLSTASSVLAISRLCSAWILVSISYVVASDPSSLRHRCRLWGFSSSSERARTFVRSCSSSFCSRYSSFSSAPMFEHDELRRCSSRRSWFSLSFSSRASSRLSRYAHSPRESVCCCSLTFSYSSASSSLRRTSWVLRMSRSCSATSYSRTCCSLSVPAWSIMLLRLASSDLRLRRLTSELPVRFRSRPSSPLRLSLHFCARACSICSLMKAWSFALTSSLSWSTWWCTILNLRFISARSSCVSTRLFEY
mmetsp:Transcript_10714/g.35503  ORF Transcript_10714/g.35503 Transcript_10714/m.35503 type:complete len:265 (-) Transcript_10714:1508-2302(-)